MRTVSMSVGREQVANRLADWATTSAAVRETVPLPDHLSYVPV